MENNWKDHEELSSYEVLYSQPYLVAFAKQTFSTDTFVAYH